MVLLSVPWCNFLHPHGPLRCMFTTLLVCILATNCCFSVLHVNVKRQLSLREQSAYVLMVSEVIVPGCGCESPGQAQCGARVGKRAHTDRGLVASLHAQRQHKPWQKGLLPPLHTLAASGPFRAARQPRSHAGVQSAPHAPAPAHVTMSAMALVWGE